MKYMLIMRATDEAYAAFADIDFEQILETMGTQLGRTEEARSELERAVHRCANARERAVLERKLRDLGGPHTGR